MNRDSPIVRWLRRITSTLVMISVFFAGFAGGFSLFFTGDLLIGVLALIYIVVGLVGSRLLWV